VFAIEAEFEMSRSRALRGGDKRRIGRRNFRGQRIQRVTVDAVHAEIGDDYKTVIRRKRDGMDVRFFLAGGVRAFAFVLDDVRHARSAIGAEWDRGDETLAVVGGKKHATGGVNGEVTGRANDGWFR
jgi:hypothetical protein